MNTKTYLSRAIWLEQSINSKLEQLEVLRSLATRVSAALTGDKVSGGQRGQSNMENTIVKMVSLEHELRRDLEQLMDLQREITATINRVEDLSAQVLLQLRYLCGKSWDKVASCMGYDRRTIYRLHGRALKEIEKNEKLSLNVIECHQASSV